jgi:hypothetical protein
MKVVSLGLAYIMCIMVAVSCLPFPKADKFMKHNMIRGIKENDFNALTRGKSASLGRLIADSNTRGQRQKVKDGVQTSNVAPSKSQKDIETRQLKKEIPDKRNILRKSETGKEVLDPSKRNSKPFTRTVNISKIPLHKTVLCRLQANDQERDFVAQELNLIGIESLVANVSLSWIDETRSGVLVKGRLQAELVDPLQFLAHKVENSNLVEGLDSEIDFDVEKDDDHTNRILVTLDDVQDDEYRTNLRIDSSFESMLRYHPSISTIPTTSTQRGRVYEASDSDLFDDDIPSSGDIDIGAIVTQYLCLEI